MLRLKSKLNELDLKGAPIKVGLVGAGYLGSGILNVIEHVKGMEVVILSDTDLRDVTDAYKSVGVKDNDIVCTNDVDRAEKAIDSGKKVATENIDLAPLIKSVDVIVDGTTSPKIDARIAFNAIMNRKHIVTANIEADATIGCILSKLAKASGVVYTSIDGEEPAVIKEMYDHAEILGFEVIAAGKGKNNPLQRDATPETVASKVPHIGITACQVTSFIDGSKTMFEMASAANATGLTIDVRGMHGVTATLNDLPKIFRLKKDGGILNQKGVVDYVIGGGVDPGVFLVIATENKRLMSDLEYLKLGRGPNYVLYYPYHLWFIDAPISIARAVLDGEPTIAPLDVPRVDVVAFAKRDLKVGEKLDGIGGYCVYGVAEKWEICRDEGLLPHGLTEGAKLTRDVPKGQTLTYDDVELEENTITELRRLQDDFLKV
jgi:predicted homoserine dehydrogenase-like protein